MDVIVLISYPSSLYRIHHEGCQAQLAIARGLGETIRFWTSSAS